MAEEGAAAQTPAEVFLEDFELVGRLGEGSFGCVSKAYHVPSKLTFAIKQIVVDQADDCENIVKEIDLIRGCASSNVVICLGSFFVSPYLHILMEFCEAGSVADIMRLRQKTLVETEIATILQGALHGLSHMHSKRHIHRDIKAGNVLLSKDGTAKLADFGVAGKMTDSNHKRKTFIGTPFWMAPEVIQEVGHDSLADIWSLGILTIEMAEGRPPHSELHPMRAIFKIASDAAPTLADASKWSKELMAFVGLCLVKDPQGRSSAAELLADKFIANAKEPLESLSTAITEAMQTAAELGDVVATKGGTLDGNTNTMLSTLKPKEAEDADKVDLGTMVISKNPDPGTVVIADSVDFGTMVMQGTMVTQGAPAEAATDDDRPAYMKHAEAQDKLEAANAADEPRRDSRANMEALTKNENLDAVKKEIAAMAASVASSK